MYGIQGRIVLLRNQVRAVRAIWDICGKPFLAELELSGGEEGGVDGSELAVDIDSMTTGNEVVRGLERSVDSAPDSRTLVADGDEEEEGGKAK